eukprot:TRINITY_DN93576_c0_g1_i1.p1 TRINITY_DN93576_c0_g1~~TRINITY_DN93576_c0_g1_i1.p1  ORF type:complete len:197 (+),score=27.56 TRINITY_DN93576_c0_g1_i1:304-894(+)
MCLDTKLEVFGQALLPQLECSVDAALEQKFAYHLDASSSIHELADALRTFEHRVNHTLDRASACVEQRSEHSVPTHFFPESLMMGLTSKLDSCKVALTEVVSLAEADFRGMQKSLETLVTDTAKQATETALRLDRAQVERSDATLLELHRSLGCIHSLVSTLARENAGEPVCSSNSDDTTAAADAGSRQLTKTACA